jgi:hypothetical protein
MMMAARRLRLAEGARDNGRNNAVHQMQKLTQDDLDCRPKETNAKDES